MSARLLRLRKTFACLPVFLTVLPVLLTVAPGGALNAPSLLAGEEPPPWLQGNCNLDRGIDLSDAIGTLENLFAGGANPLCAALCDVNGDGQVTMADPTAILGYLFLGAPLRIPAPPREELCDAADNDCDGQVDEDCPPGPPGSVVLSWDPVTEDVSGDPEAAVGYWVHTGKQAGPPWRVRDVETRTVHRVTGLIPGVRYYFMVTAHDLAGNQSLPSEIVSVVAGP